MLEVCERQLETFRDRERPRERESRIPSPWGALVVGGIKTVPHALEKKSKNSRDGLAINLKIRSNHRALNPTIP